MKKRSCSLARVLTIKNRVHLQAVEVWSKGHALLLISRSVKLGLGRAIFFWPGSTFSRNRPVRAADFFSPDLTYLALMLFLCMLTRNMS